MAKTEKETRNTITVKDTEQWELSLITVKNAKWYIHSKTLFSDFLKSYTIEL